MGDGLAVTRDDRIAGGFWGLLVGDALGVPYEFKSPSSIGAAETIVMDSRFAGRTYPNVPPGTWSDDGAQALCLLESLLETGLLDPTDLMRRFVRWYRDGHLAVGGHVFDIGIQTSQALSAFGGGRPALESARTDEQANGNGSLMRVLPLALWHQGTDAELASNAELSSRPTHGHRRAGVCCALYVLWARRILEDHPSPWLDAVATLRALLDDDGLRELEQHVRPDDPAPGTGTGYVVDALRSARACVENTPSYADAVRAAIKLGHDTDTTACIAGGIAGLKYGYPGIPAEWLGCMRGREIADPLLSRLLSMRR